jgi:hypothetical protein
MARLMTSLYGGASASFCSFIVYCEGKAEERELIRSPFDPAQDERNRK